MRHPNSFPRSTCQQPTIILRIRDSALKKKCGTPAKNVPRFQKRNPKAWGTRRRGPWNDCANLPVVVETASQQTRIGWVLADAEFDSERNHTYIRKKLGAQSVIPAKRGKKTWRVRGVRAEMRRAFPQRIYRSRALIESVFSAVKRKLSARAPGRTLRMQMRQALLLGLSFNLYRLRHRHLFSSCY